MTRTRDRTPSASPVIATLTPRTSRRVVAAALQGLLGLILVWLGAILPEGGPLLRALLLLAGGLMLAGTLRLWRATAARIELTAEALSDSDGRVLARIEQIRAVDRGPFAFKPSNGFLLHLDARARRAWVPGLWWRVGRFVGVGGATPRNEAKAMAEAIALLIAERS